MVRLIGLWTEPADIGSFEREYLGSHYPKLAGFVGNAGTRTARCIDGPYYRFTEVHFASLDDLNAAMETDVGRGIRAAAEDLAAKYGIRFEVLVVAEAS